MPDGKAEGHRAGGFLALLGVVAAERQQLFANHTRATLLLLAHSIVSDYSAHLIATGKAAGGGLAATGVLQVLDAPLN